MLFVCNINTSEKGNSLALIYPKVLIIIIMTWLEAKFNTRFFNTTSVESIEFYWSYAHFNEYTRFETCSCSINRYVWLTRINLRLSFQLYPDEWEFTQHAICSNEIVGATIGLIMFQVVIQRLKCFEIHEKPRIMWNHIMLWNVKVCFKSFSNCKLLYLPVHQ